MSYKPVVGANVTRDGRKAVVLKTDTPIKDRPVLGYIEGEARACSWHADGTYRCLSFTKDDIVGPWVEPQPRLLAYLDRNEHVRMIPEDERIFESSHWRRLPHLDEPVKK